MIDFELPPEIANVQKEVAAFVRDIAIPAELELGADVEIEGDRFNGVVERLRAEAKQRNLFNPHLPPEWGGVGLGPLGMAIVSQECGASGLASLGLNAMAPDEGHAPPLARRYARATRAIPETPGGGASSILLRHDGTGGRIRPVGSGHDRRAR